MGLPPWWGVGISGSCPGLAPGRCQHTLGSVPAYSPVARPKPDSLGNMLAEPPVCHYIPVVKAPESGITSDAKQRLPAPLETDNDPN